MSRGWFPPTGHCKCGHSQERHNPDGKCHLFAEAIPTGTPKPGFAMMVKQPEGTCHCREFDGEPWPWCVWASYTPIDTGGGVWTTKDAQPDHWGVMNQGIPGKRYGPFKAEAGAKRKCDELNREMAQGPLDPAFLERRKRLKRFAPYFHGWAHEGPSEARWPVRPERYLIESCSDDGDSCHELVDTLDQVRERLEDESAGRVVDLDTGKEVPYERTVTVVIDLET